MPRPRSRHPTRAPCLHPAAWRSLELQPLNHLHHLRSRDQLLRDPHGPEASGSPAVADKAAGLVVRLMINIVESTHRMVVATQDDKLGAFPAGPQSTILRCCPCAHRDDGGLPRSRTDLRWCYTSVPSRAWASTGGSVSTTQTTTDSAP